MTPTPDIDSVLIHWGDRLFYPGNRIIKTSPPPKLGRIGARERADAIRQRIEATIVRRAPQVMVKVTGGGRGIKAIAAHLRYISKNGRLKLEDERGEMMRGKGALHDLAEDWRLGGTLIDDIGDRREAYNIMLSMPRGIDPLYVQKAAREFAKAELADHKYVMVLHDHQANPHVHVSVRAESMRGKRLNPRKADLSRWRQSFAEKLRGWGIEAEASSRTVRSQGRESEPLWRIKARGDQRLKRSIGLSPESKPICSAEVENAWRCVIGALQRSDQSRDRKLAVAVAARKFGGILAEQELQLASPIQERGLER